jgi:hypothetical protein
VERIAPVYDQGIAYGIGDCRAVWMGSIGGAGARSPAVQTILR